jgi:hypothetical protein
MSDLIDHLETYLGPIVSGYAKDDEGKALPFQIARFENAPPNTITLVTIGFSDTRLAMRGTGRRVRQEYFVTVNLEWDARNLPALLHQVAMEAYQRDSAYLRGQVLGPRGTLVAGTAFEALYVATEAHFAKERGYDAFEELLVERDPDLRDLGRATIV